MADPLASERAMTYSEPPIYPSSNYVSVQYTERPTDIGRWWGPNQRFTITIRSPAQNEFFDPNKMRLQFSVLSIVQPAAIATGSTAENVWDPGPNDPAPTQFPVQVSFPQPALSGRFGGAAQFGLAAATANDAAATLPGALSWGVSVFSSVRVSIPGVPVESFCTANIESQWMISTRLLCASGVGSIDSNIGKLSFKISGEAELAGARSVVDRLNGVSAGLVWTDRTFNTMSGDDLASMQGLYDPTTYRGCLQTYSVPLSLFCHIFNNSSNLIPLGFYSTSADTCTFTFETAPVNDAINNINADLPMLAGPATYYIVDPAISITKLQISSPAILQGVESLYRGQMSLPIAPGINVPLAFVMKFTTYGGALTRIDAPTGFFSLDLPANQPSIRGIALRFCSEGIMNGGLYSGTRQQLENGNTATDYSLAQPWQLWNTYSTTTYGQWNGRYLLNLVPVLRGFQLRIASMRVPLDPLTDQKYTGSDIPRGLSSNPFEPALGAWTNPVSQAVPGGTALVAGPNSAYDMINSFRECTRLYKQGKHLFSPFATEEDPNDNALSPFFIAPVNASTLNAEQSFFRGSHVRGREMTAIAPPFGIGTSTYDLARNTTVGAIRSISGQQGAVRWSGSIPMGTDTSYTVSNRYYTGQSDGLDKVPLPNWCNTGLFLIPLETVGAVYNHRDDVFALRGLDLRSIGQINISGEILGVATGSAGGDQRAGYAQPANQDAVLLTALRWDLNGFTIIDGSAYLSNPGAGNRGSYWSSLQQDGVNCRAWCIRGYIAYDQEHVLLPGRVDVDAQFSLVPTGATSIPSGGAPAM